MDDNFYITLPSNEFSSEYPHNKNSHYFTSLPKPIDLLPGEWEAALVEIHYPHNWYSFDDENQTLFSTGYILEKNQDVIEDDQHTWKTKPLYRKSYLHDHIRTGYYKSCFDLVQELNEKLKTHNTGINISWNIHSKKITFNFTRPSYIRLNRYLAAILGLPVSVKRIFTQYPGLKEFEYNNTHEISVAKLSLKPLTSSSSANFKFAFTATNCADLELKTRVLYIYSNLIEHSYVGHYSVPLLRAISTNSENSGKYVNTTFDDPHYVGLASSSSSIKNIEIAIVSGQGSYVKFQSGGVVLLKLHFRHARGRQLLHSVTE